MKIHYVVPQKQFQKQEIKWILEQLKQIESNQINKQINNNANNKKNNNENLFFEESQFFYTSQFISIYKTIISELKNTLHSTKTIHSEKYNQILGCDYININSNTKQVFVIIENKFHLLPILHSVTLANIKRLEEYEKNINKEKTRNTNLDIIKFFVIDIAHEKIEEIKYKYDKISSSQSLTSNSEVLFELFKFSPSFYYEFYEKQLSKKSEIEQNNKKDKNITSKIRFNMINIEEMQKFTMQQITKFYSLFEKSKKIGILISNKNGQYNYKLYQQIKQLLINQKKDPIAVLTNNISNLTDFNFIKLWINTACPRIVNDYKNLINGYDFMYLLKLINNQR